jgi:hypothetical protein
MVPECSQVVPSRRNDDSRINVPSWVPRKTHASSAPQARARPTRSTPVIASRSPSKLGLQAPTLEARPQSGAYTSTYLRLQSVGPERARAHDKRVTSLSAPISKYVLGIINMWLDRGGPVQRTVLNRHRWDTCNQSLARIAQPSPYPIPSIVPPGLQLFIHIYISCDSNMIIVTIIYFLSLASDRQSLDFYQSPVA